MSRALPWQPNYYRSNQDVATTTIFDHLCFLLLARQLSSHQLKFVKLLSELQRKEEEEEAGFSLRGFESCTSQIRDTVAEVSLWRWVGNY